MKSNYITIKFKTEACDEVTSFIENAKTQMEINPFLDGFVVSNGTVHSISMKPVFNEMFRWLAYFFGLLWIVGLIMGHNLLFLLGFGLFLFVIAKTQALKFLYRFLLKIGLKKAGYTEKVRFI